MTLKRARCSIAVTIAGLTASVIWVPFAASASRLVRETSPARCAAVAEQAIRHDVTLTALPRACRGLGAAQLRQAAAQAIREESDHFAKVRRRQLAIQASAKVEYLFEVAARMGSSTMATLLLAIPDQAPATAIRRTPVLVIAAHGAFAATTILLALLTAIAAH